MNGLNDAFERLREVVPNVNTEQVNILILPMIQYKSCTIATKKSPRVPSQIGEGLLQNSFTRLLILSSLFHFSSFTLSFILPISEDE